MVGKKIPPLMRASHANTEKSSLIRSRSFHFDAIFEIISILAGITSERKSQTPIFHPIIQKYSTLRLLYARLKEKLCLWTKRRGCSMSDCLPDRGTRAESGRYIDEPTSEHLARYFDLDSAAHRIYIAKR
jgi:hypothetical protein